MVASHMPLTGDLACNPGMFPDWESTSDPSVCRLALNPLSHTGQGNNFQFFKGEKMGEESRSAQLTLISSHLFVLPQLSLVSKKSRELQLQQRITHIGQSILNKQTNKKNRLNSLCLVQNYVVATDGT